MVLIYGTTRVADALNSGAVLIARGRRSHSTACLFSINGTAVERVFARKIAKTPPFPSKNTTLLPLAPRPLPLLLPSPRGGAGGGALYFAIFICNTFLLFVNIFRSMLNRTGTTPLACILPGGGCSERVEVWVGSVLSLVFPFVGLIPEALLGIDGGTLSFLRQGGR